MIKYLAKKNNTNLVNNDKLTILPAKYFFFQLIPAIRAFYFYNNL